MKLPGARIGLAGYMGAGKSTCARIFASRGFQVIDADSEAKRLMDSSDEIREQVSARFGGDVLRDGKIDFVRLGAEAFGSMEALRELNAIVHPPLLDHLDGLVREEGSSAFVLDASLLPLWKKRPWVDVALWVCAEREVRLRRLVAMKGVDEAQTQHRMDLQEQLFAPPVDPPWRWLENSGSMEELRSQLAPYLSDHSAREKNTGVN